MLLISLSFIHIPINFEIVPQQKQCFTFPGVYQAFLSLWNLIIWSWLPTAGMIVFGLLTIQNIHRGKRMIHVQNIGEQQLRNRKKTDNQMIRMMLIQSFLLGSTTTTFSIMTLYITGRAKSTDDALKKVTDNYISTILNYVSLIGSCISFYLFTLSSKLFRRELTNLFYQRIWLRNFHNTIVVLQRTE